MEKGDFMKNLWKPIGQPYFCKVWGMLLEVEIIEKTIQKTEWILEGIFDGFWLNFGAHFAGKRL